MAKSIISLVVVSRYTGYGRALDLSAKASYGMDKICGETIGELNEAFITPLKPGYFRKFLCKRAFDNSIKQGVVALKTNFAYSSFQFVFRIPKCQVRHFSYWLSF
jgi:hypothetical protein